MAKLELRCDGAVLQTWGAGERVTRFMTRGEAPRLYELVRVGHSGVESLVFRTLAAPGKSASEDGTVLLPDTVIVPID